MKLLSISLSLAFMATVSSADFSAAQSPQTPPPAAHEHGHPAPTNLKVLPKDLTGDQVHDLMHEWEADLGVTCKTCHVENPKDIGPNGRPRMNYAADVRQEKASARIMYKMLEDINTNYVAKIEDSGMPVTCGTCHQGHLNPEPYTPENRPRPAAAGQKPAAPH